MSSAVGSERPGPYPLPPLPPLAPADPYAADGRQSVEERALVRLSDRHRECLVLRSEGLSYAEIAAALGVAQGSVGTLLARAERAFKEAYLAQRGGM